MKNMIFVPTDDITVKELSTIVSGLIIVIPKDGVYDKLDASLQKHFKAMPEKKRIITP